MTESAGFERLRQRRLRYVESARENDFEEGLKSLLSELYPDNAHFIYELLQNAEDAGAATIEFTLTTDHLTVTHDGERPFSLSDIEAITGIGKSTKKDDPTLIGKFGVGFKAVFAYTTRPEIRSGEHSFAITDLFVPEGIPGAARRGVTTFAFPFDRHDKPPTAACAEVERGLTQLDEKTLLFLNNISTITYELPDGTVGIVERQEVNESVVRIRKAEGDDFVESRWLRLTGPSSVHHQGSAPLTVAAAFRMELVDGARPNRINQGVDSGDGDARHSIVPISEGDVSIYFPAVKESSGLRFHIHAPFASTVARDSVRDDPGNVQLIDDIASIIVSAFAQLRDQGLISDTFLATLPNDDDQIGHPYNRIRDAITEAFNERDITPVWGNARAYAAARSLVSSPSEFRNWLDPSDLPILFDLGEITVEETPRWIRDRDGRAGKFLAGLDTIEFGWSELGHCLENVCDPWDLEFGFSETWTTWLETKSDARISDLYELLGRGLATHQLRVSDMPSVPLIRLRRRGTREHVKGLDTYLPSGRSDTVQSRVPVELAYFEDDEDQARANNLRAFYTAAGVKRWSESSRIEQRLAAYQDKHHPVPTDVGIDLHLEDIRAFVRFGLSNRQSARQTFGDVPLLLAPQSDGGMRWVTPRQIFLDLPFRDTGLSLVYPRVKLYWQNSNAFAYDQEPYPLAGLYLDVEDIDEFVESVGARVDIQVTEADVTMNTRFSRSWRNSNRENSYGKKVDWGVEGLDHLLGSGDPRLLRALWHAVVAAPASKADAYYKANSSARGYQMESQLAQALKSTPWVMDRNGAVKLPREMVGEDLPDDWAQPAHTSLVYRLDFGVEAAKRRQAREGVTDFLRDEGLDEEGIEVLREAKELGLSIAEIREWLKERSALSRFPDGASDDADRRSSIAGLDAMRAPQHTAVARERSVVEGQAQASAESRLYLRGQYTNATGRMFCQACQKPLPFKTKDGLWYFEAVRLVTGRKHVHAANAIALCPLCAALYKYARTTSTEALLEELATMPIANGQGTVNVPVVLDGKRVKIAFTGKHAIDIQAAMRVAGGERESAGSE